MRENRRLTNFRMLSNYVVITAGVEIKLPKIGSANVV